MKNGGMMRKGDFIQTYSGYRFYPFDPSPDEICIEDIAHALSMIPRFGGHTVRFYSVAQHSVQVSRMVPRIHALQALMHDAAEPYLLDLPRPIKSAFPGYREDEEIIMQVIAKKFGFQWPKHQFVSDADDRALASEAVKLLKSGPCDGWAFPWHELWSNDGCSNEIQFPNEAENRFLSRFTELTL